MAVRTNGFDGDGTAADIAAGFAYTGRKGIPIANVSLGGTGGAPDEIRVMKEAIVASPDTLFVVAAGNEETNNDKVPSYPCNYDLPNVLCVAAIDSRARMADFSNYGRKSVDVGAPGVDIESTVHNLSYPLEVDFANGIADFDQQPYPWKLTEKNGNPRLTFDGRDGAVPTPVSEATATLTDPVDLSEQRFCRLDLGNLGYADSISICHGNQVFGVQLTVDGGPPVEVDLDRRKHPSAAS